MNTIGLDAHSASCMLAELQRGGSVKEVHHLEGAEAQLRRRNAESGWGG